MANKIKETVDYFPFFVADGRTFYLLKKRYGALGIGYFTELCRLLARTPGHVFSMRDDYDRERFLDFIGSKEHPVVEVEMFYFLDILAQTGKIDPDLWMKKRLVTSGDFLNTLSEAYRQRKGERPTLEKVKEEYNSLPDIDYDPREDDTIGNITGIYRYNNGIITECPVQRKEKKRKEKHDHNNDARAQVIKVRQNIPINEDGHAGDVFVQVPGGPNVYRQYQESIKDQLKPKQNERGSTEFDPLG